MTARRVPGPVYVLRLRVSPQVDAIRVLRGALKVLGRKYHLKAISIRPERHERQQARVL